MDQTQKQYYAKKTEEQIKRTQKVGFERNTIQYRGEESVQKDGSGYSRIKKLRSSTETSEKGNFEKEFEATQRILQDLLWIFKHNPQKLAPLKDITRPVIETMQTGSKKNFFVNLSFSHDFDSNFSHISHDLFKNNLDKINEFEDITSMEIISNRRRCDKPFMCNSTCDTIFNPDKYLHRFHGKEQFKEKPKFENPTCQCELLQKPKPIDFNIKNEQQLCQVLQKKLKKMRTKRKIN
ncbi:hypothetical protein M0811_06044 [Anaeramoeba ignava]|uniref:Uncharacterized protein n=1 Tax=Anaeramoeba ignava TaxID=1746090 RepID=A0A9Q0LRR9_ANAIG|nr:hypothetical protein M0811_06044 [Anaeramoeba ignava]|eukprot:Anaeramoba_ignava/a6008_10.p1 GENE.a6008_10~~a6008_10.p1  ORF type:complete len:237 (-),score=76.43 a6008_10:19-729(-)